jgi:hypothetical protein
MCAVTRKVNAGMELVHRTTKRRRKMPQTDCHAKGTTMIAAIVRYKLPVSIDHDDCLAHYARIAPGFRSAKGLISKHFIWGEHGIAGGVYQWESLEEAKAFYSGPWRDGIVERYGMEPEIEYFTVFAVTDNAEGTVKVLARPRKHAAATS